MKHTLSATLVLLTFFLLSQFVGLFFVAGDVSGISVVDDQLVVVHPQTAMGERPEFTGVQSVIYIAVAVLIGTLMVLGLAKLKANKLWKFWYLLAVFVSISISIGVFFSKLVAVITAIVLVFLKFYKRNIFTHNVSELLIYAGIAVLLVPLFDLFWIIMLLLLISIYDIYAVWKSKHMITLAKFTAESNLFAGFSVDYDKKKIHTGIKPLKMQGSESSNKKAILGGGDVLFPLLFTAVVMETLFKSGMSLVSSYWLASIICLTSTFSLYLLFKYSKKDTFYPAMPFLSLGCFVGVGIIFLITLFV